MFTDAANGDDSKYASIAHVELARLTAEDPAATPDELNNAGFRLAKAHGEREVSLTCLRLAARAGQPHALSSLTWFLIGWEQPVAAIDAWREYAGAVVPWIAAREQEGAGPEQIESLRRQIPNFTSNIGLAMVAIGEGASARTMWSEAGAAGHAEALCFSAILSSREGDAEDARRLVGQLTPRQRDTVRSTLIGIQEDFPDSEWFCEWAQHGQALLLDST
jgi:hypothetical protein